MSKYDDIVAKQNKLADNGIRVLYKNSICDTCGNLFNDVKLKGAEIICRECFERRLNEKKEK